MFDPETITLLRAVLNDVCEDVSPHETGTRAYVASKLLEAATRGEASPDKLQQVGRKALGVASAQLGD